MQNGEDEAFAFVYRKYFDELYNYALKKTADTELSRDLVQDIFLQLYIKKDAQRNINGYLFTSLRNRILNFWQRELVQNRYTQILKKQPEPATNNAGISLEMKEAEASLNKVVDTLPPQCKKVFLLKREQNYTNNKIAEELGISINTVEQHMRKAIRILKQHYGYEMITMLLVLSIY